MAKSTKPASSTGADDRGKIKAPNTVVIKPSKMVYVFMALYQFANNGLVSGRTGGDVKMRNGRSRGMKVPALVRNAYTGGARGLLATLSSLFRTLGADNITQWNNYQIRTSDRFGVMHNYHGKTAFVQIGANLTYVGSSYRATPPPPSASNPSSVPLVSVDITTSTPQFKLNTGGISDVGTQGLIYATKVLSGGISRPSKSAYRLIGFVDFATDTSFDLLPFYEAKFGALSSANNDGKIFVQVRNINDTTGLSSALTQVDGIVTA